MIREVFTNPDYGSWPITALSLMTCFLVVSFKLFREKQKTQKLQSKIVDLESKNQ